MAPDAVLLVLYQSLTSVQASTRPQAWKYRANLPRRLGPWQLHRGQVVTDEVVVNSSVVTVKLVDPV